MIRRLFGSASSLSLVLGVLVAVIPASPSFATLDYTQNRLCLSEGSGTSADPFQVKSATDVLSMDACLDNRVTDAYFVQQNNIFFDPTRNYSPPRIVMRGIDVNYDGQGFAIQGLNSTVPDFAGLFGEVSGDTSNQVVETLTIKNLLVAAETISATYDDVSYAAVIFPYVEDANILIDNVGVVADLIATEDIAGGLIGAHEGVGNVTVRDSWVDLDITSDDGRSGGVIGIIYEGAELQILDTTVTATIRNNYVGSDDASIGGFVGELNESTMILRGSIFEGSVIGGHDQHGIGGAVGLMYSYDTAAGAEITDTVVIADVTGGTIGGFVGYPNHGSDPDQIIPISITKSAFSGQLLVLNEYYDGESAGLVGSAEGSRLTVDEVVLDAEFRDSSSSDPVVGDEIAVNPVSLVLGDIYINSTKFAASSWNLGAVNSAATQVSTANFATESSFPGLNFAPANSAENSGVWELCAGVTRPIHSIEANSCANPTADYLPAFDLAWEEPISAGYVGDSGNFSSFSVTPALPLGLVLNPFTGVIMGTAFEEAAANNYTITATSPAGSVQDVVSITTAGSSDIVTFSPNTTGTTGSLSLPVGLIELPDSPFTGSSLSFMGWSVGSASGPVIPVGGQVLLFESTEIFARWLVEPDCSANGGGQLDSLYELCIDADGLSLDFLGGIESGDYTYFEGRHPYYGWELWRTDGTMEGTQMVMDLEPGLTSGLYSLLAVSGDTFYLAGIKNGIEGLYVSDGTRAGTTLLTSTVPYDGELLGESLIFQGYDSTNGEEPWITDGTSAGTRMIADVDPQGDGGAFSFVSWRDKMFFSANGGGGFFETDGTAQNTIAAVTMTDNYIYPILVAQDELYFRANTGFYVLENPGATPVLLLEAEVYEAGQLPNGQVVFGVDPVLGGTQAISELWITDGTPSGTRKIADLGTGYDAYPGMFRTSDTGTFFSASDSLGREVIWFTDGTSSGTNEVFEDLINAEFLGLVNSSPVISYGGILYIGSDPGAGGGTTPTTPSITTPSSSSGAAAQVSKTELVDGILKVSGTNLSSVMSASIAGKTLFTKYEGGQLHVLIPSDLAPGTYSLELLTAAGSLTVQGALIISATSSLGDVSAWTKKLSSAEVKVYVKNLVNAGKVNVFLNGIEVAWVRAVDAQDPKLKTIATGPMAGTSYLVRTLKLQPGKNVIEVFQDGQRIRRTAYTR